jgi:hypothetical protein
MQGGLTASHNPRGLPIYSLIILESMTPEAGILALFPFPRPFHTPSGYSGSLFNDLV